MDHENELSDWDKSFAIECCMAEFYVGIRDCGRLSWNTICKSYSPLNLQGLTEYNYVNLHLHLNQYLTDTLYLLLHNPVFVTYIEKFSSRNRPPINL